MGVKLDGRDPREFGLIFLKEHYHPMTPEIRNKTLTIPGMSGEWDFGSEWGSRPFSLPFGIIDKNKTELQRKLRAFVAFLVDSIGKPRGINLSFDYEPEKEYTVKLNGMVDVERVYSTGRFDISLIAHDPYAYADMKAYDPVEVPEFGEAGEEDYYENTESFLWQYPDHYSGIHNYSTLNTELIMTIEGTVTNPSITHLETNKKLTLPSIANQKIEIDSSKFTVKVDGISSLSGTNGNFFSMVSGDNGFLFEGENPNATVTYNWKHKFI